LPDPPKQPTKNDSAQVHALVNRQVQAWEKRDFAIAARLAIQWDWSVIRKRATTHDAILVHLVGGKIATWNEYFG
jgi:hypothetical protein